MTITGHEAGVGIEPGLAQAQQSLLLVDDDAEILTLVAEQLRTAGFHIFTASNGGGMRAILAAQPIDLIVLDLNLPGEDGLSLCRETRAHRDIPIIMLTARGEPIDRIIGLEVGADDYIAKPFEPRELLARIRSVIRRTSAPHKSAEPAAPKRAKFRDWTLDFENRRLLKADGRVFMLSGSEYSLLKFLVEHANQVLTRDQILTLTAEHAEDRSAHSTERIADLQISRLRQKLNDNARTSDLIQTIRSQGYVLAAPVTFE
jgi:two-component system OmpR family response regulator